MSGSISFRKPIRCVRLLLLVAVTAAFQLQAWLVVASASDGEQDVPSALADAKFPAAFIVENSSPSSPSAKFTLAVGDFTMRGPIASSLRSLTYPRSGQIVFTPSGVYSDDLRFDERLNRTQWLTEAIGRAPPTIRKVAAYDSKRKHLVCMNEKKTWYRYNLLTKRWIDRRDVEEGMSLMVYDPDQDALVTLGSGKRLRIFSVEGELQDTFELSSPIPISAGGEWHATWQRGHVIVIGSVKYARDKPSSEGQIYAIEAATGKVRYSGTFSVLDDAGKSISYFPGRPADAIGVDETELHQKWRERMVAAGKKLTADDRAAFERGLKDLEALAAKKMPESRGGVKQIHVVGLYDGDSEESKFAEPTVHVTERDGPVDLILSSNIKTNWSVIAAPEVKIDRIIVSGRGEQEVRNKPEKSTLVRWSRGSDDPRTPELYDETVAEIYPGQIRAATGIEPTTIQLHTKNERSPLPDTIEVGPLDPNCRRDYIASIERDLGRRLALAEVGLHAFTGVMPLVEYRVGIQWNRATPWLNEPRAKATLWGEFSVEGPKTSTLRPIEVRAMQVADGGAGRKYVSDGKDVYHVDDKSGKPTALGWVGTEDDPNRFTRDGRERQIGIYGIVWNTQANTLIAAIKHISIATLYRWDEANSRWHRYAEMGYDAAGLAYDSKRNLYYSLGSYGSTFLRLQWNELNVYTAEGVRVGAARLSVPITLASREQMSPQLVIVNDRLVAITPTHERYAEPGVNASEVYIVDPLSGKTHFAGAFKVKP